MFPTIVFGDTVIERKEYVAALKAQHGAARLYFRQTYGVDPAEDGWDKAHDGEVPCRWLASRAIDELRRRHAAYLIGVDLGQVADDSYASIVARMEAVNSGNAELKSDGGIVYGRFTGDIKRVTAELKLGAHRDLAGVAMGAYERQLTVEPGGAPAQVCPMT